MPWYQAAPVPAQKLLKWITPFVDVATFEELVEVVIEQPQVLTPTPSLHTPTPNLPSSSFRLSMLQPTRLKMVLWVTTDGAQLFDAEVHHWIQRWRVEQAERAERQRVKKQEKRRRYKNNRQYR